jgi:hypothetical protein
MRQLPPERVIKLLEIQPRAQPPRNAGQYPLIEKRPRLRLRAIPDRKDLSTESVSNLSIFLRIPHLAMLHDIELAQPRLIERIARRVYNMAQAVLFCEDEHRIE